MTAARAFQLSRAVPEPLFALHLQDNEVQHRRLAQLLAETADRLKDNAPRAVLARLYARVVEFIAVHFADEEQFMTEWGYPEPLLKAHASAHEQCLRRAEALRDALASEDQPAPAYDELVGALQAWFELHDATEDRPYLEYFRTAWRTEPADTAAPIAEV